MAEIALEHISKRYGDGFEAVKDMNLDVADGEFMILVGPSGCGKSTALRMVAGLEDITDGELKIGGQVVNDKTPKERDIAMVFQNYALYPHMTVRDNMGFALKLAKVPQAEINQKVEEAARILDLGEHLDRKPANLSGGQRQRVAMGRAIVRNPSAFLMDEPLSNLDAKLRVQMRTEISRIQQRLETTTIYVTHDQTEALTLGDRIAVMRSGVLQQVGPPQELYNYPTNLFVAGFIGSPSMNFLPAELDGDSIKLPIGTVPIPDVLRARLGGRSWRRPRRRDRRSAPGGLRGRDAGRRPLARDHVQRQDRRARVDGLGVLRLLRGRVRAHHREGARGARPDAGAADLPQQGDGEQVVARLEAASRVRQGQDARAVVQHRAPAPVRPRDAARRCSARPTATAPDPARPSAERATGERQPAPPEQPAQPAAGDVRAAGRHRRAARIDGLEAG